MPAWPFSAETAARLSLGTAAVEHIPLAVVALLKPA